MLQIKNMFRVIFSITLLTGVLVTPLQISAHQGRQFVIVYPEGSPPARLLAHVLGMVALDRLGFDVKILSFPAGEIIPRVVRGDAGLAVRPSPVKDDDKNGWREVNQENVPGAVLWGSYTIPDQSVGLWVPADQYRDLRFDAVRAVLGKTCRALTLELFDRLIKINMPEGHLSGPVRLILEENELL